jgi:general stress protein YciG
MARKSKAAATAISEYLAEIGRKGGQAKVPKGAAALTPEERRERGRQAAQKRWGKKKAGSPKPVNT